MASGDDDEPARKRRASVTNSRPGDEGEGEEASMPPDVADELPETNGPSHDGTPAADEAQDNEVRPAPAKGRKGKKGKRKGKKTKNLDEDQEAGVDRGSRAASDERPADDDAGEVENNAKVEEECKCQMRHTFLNAFTNPPFVDVKKTSAMDTLVSLEKQFANLRDRYEPLHKITRCKQIADKIIGCTMRESRKSITSWPNLPHRHLLIPNIYVSSNA